MSAGLAVVLTDKFRGSLTGGEVAGAVAAALTAHAPRLEVLAMPLSDGGRGTLRLLADRTGATPSRATVTGPYGSPVSAAWAVLPDGTAVIESAEVCGWDQAGDRRGPLRSTTRGVGELVALAAAGHRRILVAIGDTVTIDGGLGAIEALGWAPVDAEVLVAADVDLRFTDAARGFGRQKGAKEADLPVLDARLEALRARYRAVTGKDVDDVPCGGAGGGLAGALGAFGARCAPGFTVLSEVLGLAGPLARADIVVTGEGRFDRTSLLGKGTFHLLTRGSRTARRGLIAGSVERCAAHALRRDTVVVPFTRYRPAEAEAIRDARAVLARAAADLVAGLLRSP
ncbi:glycerate kinase [Actinomadura sp. 9N215]|uniref:glycerate kinase n=1 Tax=Actinomadura sp. 9N215 TaxID=3375150 RepID=UPI00378C8F39